MRKGLGWVVVAFLTLCLIAAAYLVLPPYLYSPLSRSQLDGIEKAKGIELQTNRLKLQNDARGTLLQGIAGAFLVLGAYLTWRQLQVNKEGQVTERFTRAIDHLGHEAVDVRVGGIYALERIAKDSPYDRRTIAEVLANYIRLHSPWPPSLPGQYQPDADLAAIPVLGIRAPDVHAAIVVIGRNKFFAQAVGRLQLPGVDFRRAFLSDSHLVGVNLRNSNLGGARLEWANLREANLYKTNLRKAEFLRTDLSDAKLPGAYLRETDLAQCILNGAVVDLATSWPDEWDVERAEKAGMIVVPVIAAIDIY
jgi:Pentapeptide repeats (8 copies)